MRPTVTLAGEGSIDLAVLRRLARDAGLDPVAEYGKKGKSYLDRQLRRFAAAAAHGPWIVLRDLDTDAPCPGALALEKLPASRPQNLVFRIAVRAVEAWLLGDREGFAAAFHLQRAARFPEAPETVADPKRAALDLLSRSRRRHVREENVFGPPTGWREGPVYTANLSAFAEKRWNPAASAERCPSLHRARQRIEELARRCGAR